MVALLTIRGVVVLRGETKCGKWEGQRERRKVKIDLIPVGG
jgi:hypothetical protein